MQPVFGLRNSSSVYKQMIRSSYENSLDRLLHVENQSATASREAPVFDVHPDPVESPQDSLDVAEPPKLPGSSAQAITIKATLA